MRSSLQSLVTTFGAGSNSISAFSFFFRPSNASSITSASDRKTLEASITAELLRGCHIKDILRGFGKAFCSNNGSLQVDASDYDLSRVVTKLDDFISHSWATSRWTKFLTLCFVYNSTAALVIAYAAGLVIMVLQLDSIGMLPKPSPVKATIASTTWWQTRGVWCCHLCPILCLVVFFFWQRLKAACGFQQRLAFLDRLCVDQVNEDRKQAAILGLGGFLYHCDRIVVCWTPQYFTRLWCVYEVATWLHLNKPLANVLFVPVYVPKFILYVFIASMGQQLGFFWISLRYSQIALDPLRALLFFLLGLCIAPEARRQVHMMQQLPSQIRRFSLQDVTCFCCANQHRMPGTGARLPCDRQLVFRTLATWFSSPESGRGSNDDGSVMNSMSASDSSDQQNVLLKFETMVRNRFGAWILCEAGPTRLPYKWVLMHTLPYYFHACDAAAGAESMPTFWIFFRLMLCSYVPSCFLVMPSIISVCVRLTAFFNKSFGFQTYIACDCLINTTLALSCTVVGFILSTPTIVLNQLSASIIPVITWNLVCLAITIALYPELRFFLRFFRRACDNHPVNENARTSPSPQLSDNDLSSMSTLTTSPDHFPSVHASTTQLGLEETAIAKQGSMSGEINLRYDVPETIIAL